MGPYQYSIKSRGWRCSSDMDWAVSVIHDVYACIKLYPISACALVQLNGFNVLFDPIFSDR